LADVPVPGAELSDVDRHDDATKAGAIVARAIPDAVHGLLTTLWSAGHAAYAVGGGPRDVLLGRPTADWDLATSALPEQTAALFPGAVYENRFGTVAVRSPERTTDAASAADPGELQSPRGPVQHEITTFRSDHDYA